MPVRGDSAQAEVSFPDPSLPIVSLEREMFVCIMPLATRCLYYIRPPQVGGGHTCQRAHARPKLGPSESDSGP